MLCSQNLTNFMELFTELFVQIISRYRYPEMDLFLGIDTRTFSTSEYCYLEVEKISG